jgi:hypothetical protein
MSTAKTVLQRVALSLQDPSYVRWTKPEMLDWLTEAQRAIARTPGVYSITRTIDLVPGTKQAIPSDGWSLITVTRNFDGDTPLSPVRLVTRSLIDTCVPDWHMSPPYPLVENYTYDDRYPKEFFVFPPNDGTGRVEVVYMGIPAALTSEDDELVLDDTFLPALTNYVLYRAVMKESDYASGMQSAQAFFSAYNSELTLALEARSRTTPNAALVGGAVNANGGTE